MKKKLLSLIAVSAAIATAGGALMACGGDNDGVNREVTAEQWAAALNAENFTSNIKVTANNSNKEKTQSFDYTLIVGAEKYGNYAMSYVAVKDGVKQREESIIRIVGTEFDTYYKQKSRLDDDNNFVVGEWSSVEDEHSEFTVAVWEEDVLNQIGYRFISALAETYEDFTYSNGAYTMSVDEIVIREDIEDEEDYYYMYKMTATHATLKFANNKLVYVEMTWNQVSESKYDDDDDVKRYEEEGISVIEITYGTQTVTAPTSDND